MRFPWLGLLTGLFLMAAIPGCDRTVPVSTSDDPPVIRSVTASPDHIVFGNTSTLTVDALDPSGGPLIYEWDAGLGDVFGFGAEVYYSARPCCLGRNEIIVRVVTQSGAAATASVYVQASAP